MGYQLTGWLRNINRDIRTIVIATTVALMPICLHAGARANAQLAPTSQPTGPQADRPTASAPASTTRPASVTARFSERKLGAYSSTLPGLLNPVAVAIDAKEQIYVAESGRHQIAVFDRNGKRVLNIGRKGSGDGALLFPSGIGIASDGELYVSDSGNHRIVVFDRTGRFIRNLGGHGTKSGQLIRPMGVAIAEEHLYVADAGNDRVQIFDRKGGGIRSIGTFGAKPGAFRRPVGVALDRDQRLYVLDRDNNRIQAFDKNLAHLRTSGEWGPFPGMVGAPQGMCIHHDRLYVADTANHRIQVLDLQGRAAYQWGIHAFMPREGEGKLHFPNAIAVAPDGHFAVVCEGFENRCQIFDQMPPGQTPPTSPFLQNDPTGQSHFGISLGLSRQLVALSEEEIDQVSIHNLLDGAAVRISMVGQHGVRPGQFIRPSGLDVDAKGSTLVVGDGGNRRLHFFSLKQDPPGQLRFIPEMAQLTRTLDFAELRGTTPALRERPIVEPSFVRRAADQSLVVLDASQGVVVVLDKDFKVQQVWPADDDRMEWALPSDLAVDPKGQTVFICDAGRDLIRSYALEGKRRDEWKSDELQNPGGVAVHSDGTLFVSDELGNRILKLDTKGKLLKSWGSQGLGAGQLYRPRGLMLTDTENLVIIDYGNHRCQVFSEDGKYLNVFGATYFIRPAQRGDIDAKNEE